MGIAKILQSLRSMWNGKPKFLIDHPGEIREAFTYAGKMYYTFDMYSLPTIRGLQALDYFDEFNMRCTRDFLLLFVKAQEEILSNTKRLDLIKMGQLIRNLKDRLDLVFVPDHVYRLASVLFFTAEENPYHFDRELANKKIVEWKKDPEMLSFFLRVPLKDLVPFKDTVPLNMSIYSAVVDKINQTHLNEVSTALSVIGMNDAM